MQSNLTWQQGMVTRNDRIAQNGYPSFCLWLTGYSGAGKSTLASALERRLFDAGLRVYLLDGDNVRHGLNGDLGFGPADRKENVRRVAEVSRLFVDAGLVAITALISPYEQDREMARCVIGDEHFVEIFVDCPIEECIKRDPKGLYEKAKAGIIADFTGISSPYEVPKCPELTVSTARTTVKDCVEQVMQYLEGRFSLRIED